MVPLDIASALPASIDRDRVTGYARLHAAIDSPLGESHLVACGAQVFALTRRSPFDPLQLVELARGGVRYEEISFSRKLTLSTLAGATHVMDVSILDVESLQTFAKSLGGAKLVESAKAESVPTRAPGLAVKPAPIAMAPTPLAPHVTTFTEDRSPMRAKLLGVMKVRVSRREPAPFPGHERYVAPTAHLPRIPPKKFEINRAEAQPRKKKKKKHRADQPQPSPDAPLAPLDSPPPDAPIFQLWHIVVLVVVTPILIAAFATLARWLRAH